MLWRSASHIMWAKMTIKRKQKHTARQRTHHVMLTEQDRASGACGEVAALKLTKKVFERQRHSVSMKLGDAWEW